MMRAALPIIAVVSGACAAPPGAAFSTDPRLGVSFEAPGGLRLRPCREGESSLPQQCLAFTSPGPSEEPALMLEVREAPLEQVARDEAGFEPTESGEWRTTFGRFEPVAVERFKAGALAGMRATVACGVSDENGFHAAAGACLTVLLSDGARSVIITNDGREGTLEQAQALAESLRLLPKP